MYGLDPERVERLPTRWFRILAENMPRLEAEQTLRMMLAASAPHMKRYDRERVIRDLRRAAQIRPMKPAPPEIVEHDPAKAAEWFRANGVLVEGPIH